MFPFYKKKCFFLNMDINKYILNSTNESMRKKINYYNYEKNTKNNFLGLKEITTEKCNIITTSPTSPSHFYFSSLFLLYITYFFYYRYKNKVIYK